MTAKSPKIAAIIVLVLTEMQKQYTVGLSPAERATLRHIQKRGATNARVLQRARIFLQVDQLCCLRGSKDVPHLRRLSLQPQLPPDDLPDPMRRDLVLKIFAVQFDETGWRSL